MSQELKTTRESVGRGEFIAIIAGLMALNALAIDIMLPALPAIGDTLGITDENQRQLVVSSYLFGFGITQLAYGPISDRYGRKMPMLVGIGVYLIACFAGVLSPNFGALLLLRFVQGMGAAGSRVIALSIIRDKYSGRAMGEVMSMVFMVFMIVPVLAPTIGQVLLFTGSWQSIFVFMGLLALTIVLWAQFRLPETLAPENRRDLTLKSVSKGFMIVFTNRLSLSYALAGSVMFGALFGFINSSQQVYAELYGLGEWFPLVFAALGGTMSVSSFLNSKVVKRFGMRRTAHFAVLMFTGLSLFWFAIALFGPVPFPLFIAFHLVIMFMFGWSAPNMNALAMEPLGNVAGTASSVFGFIQTVGGALLGLIIGQLFNGTVTPITAGFGLLGIISVGFILVAENGRLFGVGEQYREKSEH